MKRNMLAVLTLVLVIFFGISGALAFKLPDTGQLKCYGSVSPYNEIPCVGTGQDGAYRINPISLTDNGNGTVTDNNTGWMWQRCTVGQNNDSTCSGAGSTYNWCDAVGTYDDEDPACAQYQSSRDICGSLNLGGYSDWRLPLMTELSTIIDYSVPSPEAAINKTYFPNTITERYWSSDTFNSGRGEAWTLSFSRGRNYEVNKENKSAYVRCVRGKQYVPSFTDNGNGTVTDNNTGLVWQQDGDWGFMTWYQAISNCEGLSFGGKTDWRLPNIRELQTIVDYASGIYLAINAKYFPNTEQDRYWSSTYYIGDGDGPFGSAWTVNFFYGDFDPEYKGSTGFGNDYQVYVRCVRGGQQSEPPNTLPDLTVTAVSNPPASKKRGESFTVKDTVMNTGAGKAGKFIVSYYLSSNVTKSADDIKLKGKRTILMLKTGKSSTGKARVTIPVTTPLGYYYLMACADGKNNIAESSKTNNCMASQTTMYVK